MPGINRYRRGDRERFLSAEATCCLSRVLDRHQDRQPMGPSVVRLLLLIGCERRAGFVKRGGRRPVVADPGVAREICRGDRSREKWRIAPGDDAGGQVEEPLAAQERRQGFVGVDAAAM